MSPSSLLIFFFFNDTATTEIYTLSLHDALPICSHEEIIRQLRGPVGSAVAVSVVRSGAAQPGNLRLQRALVIIPTVTRSEEHTSELQSRLHLVCRLLLEKKKKTQ